MTRFHLVYDDYRGTMYRVSSRRKPRGYVGKVEEVIEISTLSPTRATWTTELIEGWRPISLTTNRLGALFKTRRAAAHALLSDHSFDLDRESRPQAPTRASNEATNQGATPG